MKSISHQRLNLPPHAPVMFLPEAVLFPHVHMPLFIFEPRYRAMLAHCLEHQRMFCVALMKPGVTEAAKPEDYFSVAGLGLVRACVGHEDGTSHLILQGLARVRLGGLVQENPFRMAELRELPVHVEDTEEADALAEAAVELCKDIPPEGVSSREKLDEQISQIDDPGVVADILAYTFLRDGFRRQHVLEQLEVCERLSALIQHLRTENA